MSSVEAFADQGPLIRYEISLDPFSYEFPQQAVLACETLLYQHLTDSYRIIAHVLPTDEQELRLHFRLELDPVEWFQRQREELSVLSPVEIFSDQRMMQLIAQAEAYIVQENRMKSFEKNLFFDNGPFLTNNNLVPIFSRSKPCFRGTLCQNNSPKHAEEYFHVESCRVPVGTEVCGFRFDMEKLLVHTSTDGRFIANLRNRISPEIMVAPALNKFPEHHSNDKFCLNLETWIYIQQTFFQQEMEEIPIWISVNFGKWETAVDRNSIGVRQYCHAHIHLQYSIRTASNISSKLVGRYLEPEYYRDINAKAMQKCVSTYSQRLQNERFGFVETKLADLKIEFAEFKIELKQTKAEIFQKLDIIMANVRDNEEPHQPPSKRQRS